MKNKGLIATIIVMLMVIVVLLVTLLLVKMPSLVILDVFKFNKETETVAEPTSVETKPIPQVEIVEEKKVDTVVHTYEGYNGHVSIEYPEVTGMDNVMLMEKINEKLKMNALSIVPLYPISTALQNLKIYCEINTLSEDYITVLYKGDVVGKDANSTNVNSKNGSSYREETVKAPVANFNNFVIDSASAPLFSTMPLPKSGDVTIIENTNPNANPVVVPDRDAHTSDGGPVARENIKAPVANKGNLKSGPAVADTDLAIGPGMTGVQQGAPISGFSGSSASTVNHKIFYANTINLKTGEDIKLSDIADAKTLAKYARSTNAEYVNVSKANTSAVRTYIRRTVESKLTSELENETDFRNEDLKTWPKHFSFLGSDGYVYFTVKLSSKLGNYVIIKYKK